MDKKIIRKEIQEKLKKISDKDRTNFEEVLYKKLFANENFKKAYTRMLQQEKFVQAVISLSEDEGLDLDLARQVDERYGCLEIGDPDDMANKYAGDDKWMDNSLSIIENRFAYVIKAVVDYDEGQIINLKERFFTPVLYKVHL